MLLSKLSIIKTIEIKGEIAMKNNTVFILGITVFLLVILSFFLFLRPPNNVITDYATEQTAISNVSISKFLSISLSTNLSNGITFATVSIVPATDVNATDNYNDNSTMFVNVSADSNINVDFCIKANADLTDPVGGDLIGLGNETYLNASITNKSFPGPSTSSIALTTSYVKASEPNGPGNVTYYRFWLDVPAATPAGDYNNTVSFKGVETATSC